MSQDDDRFTAPVIRSGAFLIWEDEGPGSGHWWLTRAHEMNAAGRRDFLIAEDDLTESVICITRPPGGRRYAVIAVMWMDDFASRADAVAAAKTAAAQWLDVPHDPAARQTVQRWRLVRLWRIIWRHLPLAFAGFGLGAVLGLAVALFAVSSGLVGWPMFAAGLLIGAGSGLALKFLVDRRSRAAEISGPWARFFVLTAAAAAGAALAAGGIFILFWN